MMTAMDLLALRRQDPPAVAQGPIQADPVWGTTQDRPRLRFGGRWIEPNDPMYELIQRLMLQQQPQKVDSNQG